MKKFILTIICAAIVSVAFAQRVGQFPTPPQVPDVTENYDMSGVDINQLAKNLYLDNIQMEYLKIVYNQMLEEISECVESNGFLKTRKLDKAIANNIKSMEKLYRLEVFTKEQFETYRELLTTTIRNNFQMMWYNTFKDMPRPPRRMVVPPNFRRSNENR